MWRDVGTGIPPEEDEHERQSCQRPKQNSLQPSARQAWRDHAHQELLHQTPPLFTALSAIAVVGHHRARESFLPGPSSALLIRKEVIGEQPKFVVAATTIEILLISPHPAG